MSYSVWTQDGRGWRVMLVSDHWASAEQVARALARVTRGYVGTYGPVAPPPRPIAVGAFERGSPRSYRWGVAPDRWRAFEVGEALQRLIGRGYDVWVHPAGGRRVSYRDALERVA